MTTTALRPRPSVAALLAGLGISLVAVLSLSIFFGRYPVPYWIPPDLLFTDDMAQRLVLGLRLPRLIVSLALGMSLAAAGTVMQMIFRNPLVEPGFLGVTQGAAFGAALSILFLGSSLLVVQGVATFFALAGLALSYLLARYMRFGGWVLRLVLAGIAVSALFSSGVGVLKYLADPLTQLPEITFWLLGGLWGVTWRDVWIVLPVVIPGLLIVYLMRWRLNLLSLNDETAFSLGTAPGRERTVLLVAAVATTAAVTAIAGIVGWVGLIVPHLARRLTGANAQHTLPAAMLIGGMFAVICDDLARALLPGEIPLGILTALFGALLFIILMVRTTLRVQS
ncbi:MAG TPA: iron ABC transporter permease [Anaerolineales bacterium]|nr:iron ABC transporter permease [Anaerolineales bacterium]